MASIARHNFLLLSAIMACLAAICLVPVHYVYIYFAKNTLIWILSALFCVWLVAISLLKHRSTSSNEIRKRRCTSVHDYNRTAIFSVALMPDPDLKSAPTITENQNHRLAECVASSETTLTSNCKETNEISVLQKPDATQPTNILDCKVDYSAKSDEEILLAIQSGEIPAYQLESYLSDSKLRAVELRRKYISPQSDRRSLSSLPYQHFDYSLVTNACCENVIGYVPVPLGYVGPIMIDDKPFVVPMATTEGALVASTNRGCRAVSACGGVRTWLIRDFMTRAPVVEFDSMDECSKFSEWVENSNNYQLIKQKFDSTSRYLSLKNILPTPVGLSLFLRFSASTGDAMGMNMVSKATEAALQMLKEKYFSHTSMRIVSLSGNYCADKKAAAVNSILGRGKHVIAEATLSPEIVTKVLKTSVTNMVRLHVSKNLVGSALACTTGGFNAHSANIVTAIFLACGQDVAQTVSSSHCITVLKESETQEGHLYISCTMPCLEVGTIGGGTILPAQNTCLQMIGCAGGHPTKPGANARQLARVICATVVAGELSLLAALSSNDLVKSHMKHNRSAHNLNPVGKGPEKFGLSLKNRDSTEPYGTKLRKLADKAASTASHLHPETCSKVLT